MKKTIAFLVFSLVFIATAGMAAPPSTPDTQWGPYQIVNCGFTAPVDGAFTYDSKTGWIAAKALCEDACNDPQGSAHMCTGADWTFLRQVAIPEAPAGGVWTGSYPDVADCHGWTSTSPADIGGYDYAGELACDTPRPIACCSMWE